MTPTHFQFFARYNRWANERLYAAAAGLPPQELARPRPAAFFGTLIATLNHILVADRIWLRRIQGEGPEHRHLDELPYPEFDALTVARGAEDERILALTAGLEQERLLTELAYRNMRGEPQRQFLWQVLSHVFNHHAHHRGQAHALLSDSGLEPPPLDISYFMIADRA